MSTTLDTFTGMGEILYIQQKILGFGARLVAVSKTQPIEKIKNLYDKGIRDFGENKVQELIEKAPQLPQDIRWHLIGHLQTNKVKQVIPHVHMIHSVDSQKILNEIEKQASKENRVIPILFQYHIAKEESKFGISPMEDKWIYGTNFVKDYPHIKPSGVMGMATFTDQEAIIRSEFRKLMDIFSKLKSEVFSEQEYFKEISMGMSSDYFIALEEGSTMVRIGSLLFGSR